MPATQKASRGAILTTLFRTDALPAVPAIDAPAASRKHGWLPLLTILFLISYGLMTMLIVEQGRTIESQRALIRELFRDNTALSAAKTKAAEETAQSLSAKTQGSRDPKPGDPCSARSVDPVPVNPGTSRSSPVFPGSPATATYAKPCTPAETGSKDAIETRGRSGG